MALFQKHPLIYAPNSLKLVWGNFLSESMVRKNQSYKDEWARAIYNSYNNVNILVWHDEDFSYMLSGKIGEKEIMKIAENIKK